MVLTNGEAISPFIWVEQAGTSVESKYLLLWLPSFPDHFLHKCQEAISVLRVLNMLNMCINFLGKNLALVCLHQCQHQAE